MCTSLGFWQRSTLLERRKRISWQLERMPWFACVMASPGKHWTHWGFNVSARRFQQALSELSFVPYAYISICKATLPTGVCSGSTVARSWQWLGMGYLWRQNGSRYDRDEDYLLDAIHCGCKADCSTRRCSYRKYNLECSSACRECKGLHCSNVTLPEPESDPKEKYSLVGPKDETFVNVVWYMELSCQHD